MFNNIVKYLYLSSNIYIFKHLCSRGGKKNELLRAGVNFLKKTSGRKNTPPVYAADDSTAIQYLHRKKLCSKNKIRDVTL